MLVAPPLFGKPKWKTKVAGGWRKFLFWETCALPALPSANRRNLTWRFWTQCRRESSSNSGRLPSWPHPFGLCLILGSYSTVPGPLRMSCAAPTLCLLSLFFTLAHRLETQASAPPYSGHRAKDPSPHSEHALPAPPVQQLAPSFVGFLESVHKKRQSTVLCCIPSAAAAHASWLARLVLITPTAGHKCRCSLPEAKLLARHHASRCPTVRQLARFSRKSEEWRTRAFC